MNDFMLYKMTDEDLSNILTHGRKKLLSLVPSRRYGESLNVGHYISSGLVKFRDRYVSADNNKWYDVVRGLSSRLGDSGKRARKMNFEFNLTLEYLCDLWITQKGRCVVSNIPLSFMSGTVWDKNPYSCSIDRINNDQGYIPGNIRLLTHWANNAKSTYNHSIFEDMIRSTYNNLHSKEVV